LKHREKDRAQRDSQRDISYLQTITGLFVMSALHHRPPWPSTVFNGLGLGCKAKQIRG